ncbi:hypothetical protein WA026_004220 [Henosepilachna vigintioctopunctata]|uniref:Uncharacterized protein n=1 Tax=Henosepilachna vigintioctopunctata TaxID=420089 RepID=A0AAW1U6V9_9CUCU
MKSILYNTQLNIFSVNITLLSKQTRKPIPSAVLEHEFNVPILGSLHKVVQERQRKNAQTSSKLEIMLKSAFQLDEKDEKREAAMS